MVDQKPSVGRIVHYVSMGSEPDEDGYQKYPSVCRAAIISEVGAWITVKEGPISPLSEVNGRPTRIVNQVYHDDACLLHVTSGTGIHFNSCKYDSSHTRGTWHWPKHV